MVRIRSWWGNFSHPQLLPCFSHPLQNDDIGGVWKYDPEIEEDDLLGIKEDRAKVHSR
jgi:hypothetical protein